MKRVCSSTISRKKMQPLSKKEVLMELKNYKIPNEVFTTFSKDKDVALQAVKTHGWVFQDLYHFHDDEDVARAAIEYNCLNLQFVSERLKDNDELAILACQKHKNACNFASKRVQAKFSLAS